MLKIYYHVVTDKPMEVGQKLIFDANHHSGVYNRVFSFKDKVDEIYNNLEAYRNVELEHHLKVALRELAMEEVRQKDYPHYPSRLESLYVSRTLEEAQNWYDYFKSLDRPVFGIVKIQVNGNSFTGDACNCFDGTIDKNIELSKIYWKGNDNSLEKTPIHETIVSGDIEVVKIIKE